MREPMGELAVGDRSDRPYNYLRKMACSWGWDWGPWLTTAGVWRPVGCRPGALRGSRQSARHRVDDRRSRAPFDRDRRHDGHRRDHRCQVVGPVSDAPWPNRPHEVRRRGLHPDHRHRHGRRWWPRALWRAAAVRPAVDALVRGRRVCSTRGRAESDSARRARHVPGRNRRGVHVRRQWNARCSPAESTGFPTTCSPPASRQLGTVTGCSRPLAANVDLDPSVGWRNLRGRLVLRRLRRVGADGVAGLLVRLCRVPGAPPCRGGRSRGARQRRAG